MAAPFFVYESIWVACGVAALLALMPVISVIDLEYRIIPNKIVYPALIAFPIYLVVANRFGAPVDLVRMVIGFLAYGGVLFIVALVSRGMGMGDVKLAGLIGLVLGSLSSDRWVWPPAPLSCWARSARLSRSRGERVAKGRSRSVRSLPPARWWAPCGACRSPTGTSGPLIAPV